MPSLVTETPLRFGDHVYHARQNADERRWQIFIGEQFTPVGFIEEHVCEWFEGDVRLFVYDTNNEPLFTAKPGRDDGCVGTYMNALLAFEVDTRTVNDNDAARWQPAPSKAVSEFLPPAPEAIEPMKWRPGQRAAVQQRLRGYFQT